MIAWLRELSAVEHVVWVVVLLVVTDTTCHREPIELEAYDCVPITDTPGDEVMLWSCENNAWECDGPEPDADCTRVVWAP